MADEDMFIDPLRETQRRGEADFKQLLITAERALDRASVESLKLYSTLELSTLTLLLNHARNILRDARDLVNRTK